MKRSVAMMMVCAAVAAAAFGSVHSASGQAAAAPTLKTPAAPAVQAVPSAPGAAASTPPADPFPIPNRKRFTAETPTEATVESFLHTLWGYDASRIWRVEGIEKTSAPGVTKVSVYVSDKSPNAKVQGTAFYVTPDGRHAIADQVIDFGTRPYDEKRKMLQEQANGPASGAASKELLLVEFSDLQCPHCKDAQVTMKQLAIDFPQARIVHQGFPIASLHPAALQAAAEGFCVAKQSSDAYFKYEDAVYSTQEALTPEGTSKTLADAVTKAGLDPAAIALCAGTQVAKDAVSASVKLGESVGIDQTPTLSVNGRMLPVSPAAMPYEVLKRIIVFQAELDGLHISPPPPSLNTLSK